MPSTRQWGEVTSVLPQFHVHMGAYTPFTFKGLIDFLILADDQVDSLGYTPLERRNAVVQLVNTALIAPAVAQNLLATRAKRN